MRDADQDYEKRVLERGEENTTEVKVKVKRGAIKGEDSRGARASRR